MRKRWTASFSIKQMWRRKLLRSIEVAPSCRSRQMVLGSMAIAFPPPSPKKRRAKEMFRRSQLTHFRRLCPKFWQYHCSPCIPNLPNWIKLFFLVWPCIKLVPRWSFSQNFCLTLHLSLKQPDNRELDIPILSIQINVNIWFFCILASIMIYGFSKTLAAVVKSVDLCKRKHDVKTF